MDCFDVKLPEKTFNSKIITAWADVFHLRGIKSRGVSFFLSFFCWKLAFLCDIAQENEPFFSSMWVQILGSSIKKM